MRWIFTVFCILAVTALAQAQTHDCLPLIDAHSQIDLDVGQNEIVNLMDKAGIAHVILAARSKVKPHHIVGLARKHPDRITASMILPRFPGHSVKHFFAQTASGFYTR